ncbi:MAG: DUF2911 domain-containing protein [Saprospiraceae bacterium]|nr:DUF2911 domain-containing protein [Saprospiraceae bacterium]
MRSIFILLAFFYCVFLDGNAQLVNAPSGDNQICEVTQYLGSIANVSVKYSSPGVKGRSGKIWGSLVPWGMEANNIGSAKEITSSAGANENTAIPFSHDMIVNGNPIPAGKYGFHVIPQKTCHGP